MAADEANEPTLEAGAAPAENVEDKKDRRGAAIWGVLAAILLFAIVLLLLLTQCVPRVPDVVGLTQKDAEFKLKQAGYRVGETSYIAQTNKPAGRVAEQAPDPGAVLAKGSPVDLILIKGGELVRVPDIVGHDTPAALIALKAKHLGMSETDAFSDIVPAGAIISQFPLPGTLVKVDTEIAVTVSLGPAGTGGGTGGTTSAGAATGSTANGTATSPSSDCTKAYPGASVWSSDGDIYIRLTPGGGTRRLTSGPDWDTDPLLSPSAKYVVFMRAPAQGQKPNLIGRVCLTDFDVSMLSLSKPTFYVDQTVWYTGYRFAPSPTGTTPDSDWLVIAQLYTPDTYSPEPGGRLLVCNVPMNSMWASWNTRFRPTQNISLSQGTEAGSVRVHTTQVKNFSFFPYTGLYKF